MFRRVLSSPSALTLSGVSARSVRLANMQEALQPTPGNSGGQMSIMNEICSNPDGEEERRKPIFRHEVVPKKASHNAFATYYKWGFDSLSLYRLVNEDPGQWYNANSSTLVSNWSQIGDYANAGMWSGVWRYTFGTGCHNMTPFELKGRGFGRRDKKTGAIVVDAKETIQGESQKFVFPHTKDHETHKRVKNPDLPGYSTIDGLHGKRVIREVQYHLGQGLRFYLVDGVFGSFPGTSTPFRVITDNGTSAYVASMASHRKFNYVAQQEMSLVKRVKQQPIDEWGWRRPGVLVYHAPGFDFEAPRIVEEFGGPRPSDLSLKSPKFTALEPYSIPMKGIVAGEPKSEQMLETIAFLCARWGFYADGKRYLTLKGDSVLSPEGDRLTLVIGDTKDSLKASKHLYGAHHHRLDDQWLSRAWDLTSAPQSAIQAGEGDVVENGRVHQVLPTRFGLRSAKSHRFASRRHVSEYGFKWAHNYTDDARTKAAQGGHLFGAQGAKNVVASAPVRPSAIGLGSVDVVVVGEKAGTGAAAGVSAILAQLNKDGFLYAEEKVLGEVLEKALAKAKSVTVVAEGAAAPILSKLAQSGKQ